jgi:hypothetical protein
MQSTNPKINHRPFNIFIVQQIVIREHHIKNPSTNNDPDADRLDRYRAGPQRLLMGHCGRHCNGDNPHKQQAREDQTA